MPGEPAPVNPAPRPVWLRRALIALAGLAGLAMLTLAALYVVLLSFDYDALKPRLIAAVRAATGRELTLGGHLGLAVSARPRLEVEDVALGNPAWCSQPRMFSARKALIVVDLWPLLRQRRLVVRQLRLEGLDLDLERDAKGRTNLEFAPVPAAGAAPAAPTAPAPATDQPAAGETLALSFQSVEVKDARLRWRDQGAASPLDLEVQGLKLSQAGPDQGLSLEATGSQGGREWRVRGRLEPAGADGVQALGLEAAWGGASFSAQGRVADLGDSAGPRGVDLQLALKLVDPAELGLAGPPGPWLVQGRLRDGKAGAWRLDPVTLQAGASDLQGWLEYQGGGPRPRLTADLRAKKLDLTAWRPGPAAKKQAQAQAGGGGTAADKVFSAEPLPLDWLTALDAQLALKAAQFAAPGLAWSDLDLNLRLADGRLGLEPLRAGWSGGKLTLKLGLAPAPAPAGQAYAVDLDLGLAGSQLGPILHEAGVREVLQGELEAGASLRGRGRSVAAVMAGLNGKTWQVLRRGKLHQRGFAILGDLAGGLGGLVGGLFGSGDDTSVNCLVLGLVVRDGLASTTALALDSERVVILGRGQVNLKTEELEAAFNPQAKGGITSPGGVGLNLSELAKPFKLGGTLAQPRLSLDQLEALATLGKSLGGVLLLGPAGLAAGLASAGGEPSGLCQDALAAARKGEAYQPKGGVTEPVRKLGEGIGGAIEKLFGR
ncbi:MAG: AsmA family protein [Pseudomonadota bacterium]